ncbi:MAG: PilW family protein [Pseudomonadota bacterium]
MLRTAGHRDQSGFSLVELMLALALGIVVVTGIVQLFVGNSQTYRMLTGQARMQENARFALEFIAQAARSAGYYGCSLDRSNYVNGLGGGDWDSVPVEFDITRVVRADGNRVIFHGTERPGQRLVEVLQPDGEPRVEAPGGDPGFEAGDEVVLANCEQGALFRVSGIAPDGDEAVVQHGWTCAGSGYCASGNAERVLGLDGSFGPYTLSKLSRSYGEDSVVAPLRTVAFYIEDGALMQQVNDDPPAELVEGVEALDVMYGIDTAPDDDVRRAGQYVSSPSTEQWNDVVALRVAVTVNSRDAVTEDGEELQRTVSRTILLRNSDPEV